MHSTRATMTRRTFLKTSTAVAAGTAIGGVPALGPAQPKEIVIGWVATLTGPGATWGTKSLDGTKFAVDEFNRQGGVKALGGARLRLVTYDNETKVDLTRTLMEKLILEHRPVAVLGNIMSPATMVGTQVSERHQVPMVVVNSTMDEITERGLKYSFRVTGKAGDFYARSLGEFLSWAIEKTGKRPKMAAILALQGWERAVKTYEDWVRAAKIELHSKTMYAPAQDDFTVLLSKYKADGVEVVMGLNYPKDAVRIYQNAKTLDYNPMAFTGQPGGYNTPEFVNALKKDAEYAISVDRFPLDLTGVPKIREVNERFKARFGYDLEDSSANALGAVSAVVDALERAKSTDREAVREALAQTDLKIGDRLVVEPNGIKFNQAGDNVRLIAPVIQILQGQKRIVWPESIATSRLVWPVPKWNERA